MTRNYYLYKSDIDSFKMTTFVLKPINYERKGAELCGLRNAELQV